MLKLQNISAQLKESTLKLLDEINLEIKPGEVHLLMGPNGAGKSSLARALLGAAELKVTGKIQLDGKDISKQEIYERARARLFVAYQNPVEIPGVHLVEFLRTSYNLLQEESDKLDPWAFKDIFDATADLLGLPSNFSDRNLNEGFSGGEKKKCEILQMLILEPKYAILDEIDSGVDLDALKVIFNAIQQFIQKKKAGILIITHNPKILEYITPDQVHLMKSGRIVKSGEIQLAQQLISEGYAVYE